MNTFIWILSIFFFIGTWIEITFNLGWLGLAVGWFPAFVVAFVWLAMTGSLKNNGRV